MRDIKATLFWWERKLMENTTGVVNVMDVDNIITEFGTRAISAEAEVKDEVRRCNAAYFDRASLGIKVDQLQAKLAAAEKVVEAARYINNFDTFLGIVFDADVMSDKDLAFINNLLRKLGQALAAYEEGKEGKE